jgi:hypothetical protein
VEREERSGGVKDHTCLISVMHNLPVFNTVINKY